MNKSPRQRDDYSDRQIEAAKRVLLDVGQILSSFRESMVIVGGWVPDLLSNWSRRSCWNADGKSLRGCGKISALLSIWREEFSLNATVLVAARGKDLLVADYSAIEGRVLAWLAGEETELEVYRRGEDPYIAAAAAILHKIYDRVTKEERSRIGKTAVLACGYGGSVNAVRKFCGEDLTDEEIKEQIVNPWREAHPLTVAFWRELENACMSAVREPGRVFSARAIGFRVQKGFLLCRLPSGRLIYYYDPDIRPTETSWGEIKDSVTYMTVDSLTKQWTRCSTYGGTRHSSTTAMSAIFSKDELKKSGTMHGTNKAFDRYCQGEAAPSLSIYNRLANRGKKTNVVPMSSKASGNPHKH